MKFTRTQLKREYVSKEVQRRANMYHEWGVCEFPQEIISLHKRLAEQRLKEIVDSDNITVHNTFYKKVFMGDVLLLNVIGESDEGELFKLRWNAFNQDFMIRCSSGGYSILSFKEDAA